MSKHNHKWREWTMRYQKCGTCRKIRWQTIVSTRAIEDMTVAELTRWLRREGLPSLGAALRKVSWAATKEALRRKR